MLQESLILAVETSSRAGSVALARNADLLGQRTFSAPLRHSAEIFPAVAALLDRFALGPDDIDHVCISIGPGSFTGLRIAVTIAKTMALAHSVRVVTVNSLDVIAANLTDAPSIHTPAPGRKPPDRVATIIDAKRGQFYIAVYQRNGSDSPCSALDEGYRIAAYERSSWVKTSPDRLMRAPQFLDEFADPARPIALTGDGLLYHRDRFAAEGVEFIDQAYWSPQADNVYRLGYQKAGMGQYADPVSLTPLYLRGPQVTLRKSS